MREVNGLLSWKIFANHEDFPGQSYIKIPQKKEMKDMDTPERKPYISRFQRRLLEVREQMLANPETRRMATISHEAFLPHLNSVFTVVAEEVRVEIELMDVKVLHKQIDDDWRTPFSLIFEGPLEIQLNQGTWHLEHGVMGQLDMFLVAVGPGTYQAVFN